MLVLVKAHGSLTCMTLSPLPKSPMSLAKEGLPLPDDRRGSQEIWPKLHGNLVVKLDLDPGRFGPEYLFSHIKG